MTGTRYARHMARRTHDSWNRELALLNEELRALDADIAGARAASARARRASLSLKRDEPEPAAGVHGEPVQLADGAHIVIRPLEPDDAGELRRGLKRLSAVSAYRRFRAHITDATPEELDYLTRIDHIRHEALAALDPDAGTVVGVVRYVCDPADSAQAEVTYVVADAWQQRGVGSALIDRLASRARAAGVERFIATTLAVDTRARRLITRVADPIREHDAGGVIETTATLRSHAPAH
jgi:RimJ/RimL family protein N-acetyltransferase